MRTILLPLVLALSVRAYPGEESLQPPPQPAVAYPFEGEITGDRVHIRAGFGINYKSLKQVDQGFRVTVTGQTGEWFSVEPPEDCVFYMSKQYVAVQPDGKTGIVTADRVRIRADRSLQADVVGLANREAEVTILGEDEEWFRIAPTKGCSAWVLAKFVRPLAGEQAATRARRLAPEIAQAKLELAQEALKKQLDLTPADRNLKPTRTILEEIIQDSADRGIVGRAEAILERVKILEALQAGLQKTEPGAKPPQMPAAPKPEPPATQPSPTKDISEPETTAAPATPSETKAPAPAQRAEEAGGQVAQPPPAQEAKPTEHGTPVETKPATPPAPAQTHPVQDGKVERPHIPPYTATGTVVRLLGLGELPGTHKLVKDGQVSYVLRSRKLDLNLWLGKPVGVRGKLLDLRPRWEKPVIEVNEIECLSD